MKKRILILSLTVPLLVVSAFTLLQDDNDLKNLVVKAGKGKWGEHCTQCGNSPDTFTVFYKNTATKKLDIMIGVAEESGWWRLSTFYGVAPNDTLKSYSCKGTGRSLIWARAAGDQSYTFPTQKQVNDDYPIAPTKK
jgi:hypothetical protein